MKKRICLLIAVILLLALPVSVFAHPVPETDRTDCSIEAVLSYDGKPVTGGELTAIRVGYIFEENGDFSFRRFVDDQPVEDVQSPATVTELEQLYRAQPEHPQFTVSKAAVDAEGKARFENLATGLYLVLQDTASPGYTPIKPFLVSLPYLQDGEYRYSVDSSVKTELERQPEATEPEPTDPPGKLPQTGQLNWPIPVLAVAGLGFLLLGFVIRFSSRKDDYEK